MSTAPQQRAHVSTSTQLFLTYGTLALGMGFVPALLTTFQNRYDLSGPAMANVQNVKDVGLILAALIAPLTIRRLGLHGTQTVAVAMAMLGCLSYLAIETYGGVLIGAAMHGGAFSLGSIAIVSRMNKQPARYRRISALLATFGLASVVTPVAVATLVVNSRYGITFALYLAVLVLVSIPLLKRDRLSRSLTADVSPLGAISSAGTKNVRQLRYYLGMFAVIMAAETIVVSWLTSLMQFQYGASLQRASAALALLWLVHTASRATADYAATRFSPSRVLAAGAGLAGVGVTLMLVVDGRLVLLGVVVFALGSAPLIPIYQGSLLTSLPETAHAKVNSALGITAAAATTVALAGTGVLLDLEVRAPFILAALVLVFLCVQLSAHVRKMATPSSVE